MKTPIIEGTESLAFSDKEARRDKVAALRTAGVKHVSRRTDQVGGRMLYVVSWPKAEQAVLDEIETKVTLTQAEEVCNMENEGGNADVMGK